MNSNIKKKLLQTSYDKINNNFVCVMYSTYDMTVELTLVLSSGQLLKLCNHGGSKELKSFAHLCLQRVTNFCYVNKLLTVLLFLFYNNRTI